jgi:uncharacterized protein
VKYTQPLQNDTVINVASLLKEPVGSARTYGVEIDRFELDDELVARRIEGEARLTRLQDEILVNAKLSADVELECDRCLRKYDERIKTRFSAQYEPTIDVHTGHAVREIDDELERFAITEHHEVDLAEPLRQELIVALPMVAVCGADCPGPEVTSTGADDGVDDRLAALEQLLKDAE